MNLNKFDIDTSSVTYEFIEGALPVTYVTNYLKNEKNFSGDFEIRKEDGEKFANFRNAIVTLDDEGFEIHTLKISQHTLIIAGVGISTHNIEKFANFLLDKIPENVRKKLKIKKFYRTVALIKCDYTISDMIEEKFMNRVKSNLKYFPDFENTNKNLEITGIQFRITPEMIGDYAVNVAKGLEPAISYLLNFNYSSSKDQTDNIITVVADINDTDLKKLLSEL